MNRLFRLFENTETMKPTPILVKESVMCCEKTEEESEKEVYICDSKLRI